MIKDSGVRESFASGMVRDTAQDKTNVALVFDGPMLWRWATHLTLGAVKYAKRNWMKAAGEAELERFRESAARHFAQWYRGDTDEDHAAAVIFNINGAEYVRDKLLRGAVGSENVHCSLPQPPTTRRTSPSPALHPSAEAPHQEPLAEEALPEGYVPYLGARESVRQMLAPESVGLEDQNERRRHPKLRSSHIEGPQLRTSEHPESLARLREEAKE